MLSPPYELNELPTIEAATLSSLSAVPTFCPSKMESSSVNVCTDSTLVPVQPTKVRPTTRREFSSINSNFVSLWHVIITGCDTIVVFDLTIATLLRFVNLSCDSKVWFPGMKNKIMLSLSLLLSVVKLVEKSERVTQVCSTIGQSWSTELLIWYTVECARWR